MAGLPDSSPAPSHTILHPRDSHLGSIVEKTWLLSRQVCNREGRFEVMPDGHFGLGVVLAGGRSLVVAGGPITQRISPLIGEIEIYWLRFRPGRMPRIADVDPADLIDAPGIVLDRIRDIELDALVEKLHGTSCIRSRLELLDQFCESLGETHLCQDDRCCRILDMVDRMNGCVQVRDIAREFGLSPRTVERLLVDQVGLTPKQLIRNVRLQRTLARIRHRRPGEDLASIASASGFADQSHMINEFQKLAGRAPGTF